MRAAVIYARVSSKDQEREGYSIPAQLKLLREYARTHEFEIVHEFVDVETAKITGRKQFGEMVRFFRENASCRVAIVGQAVAPPLFDTMVVLGQARVVSRLRKAVGSI